MAIEKKQVKPTSVKKVERKDTEKKSTSTVGAKKVVAVDPKNAPKKAKEKELYIDQKEVKKAAQATELEQKKKVEKEKEKAAPKTKKIVEVDVKKPVVISMPTKKTTGKTVYHVSKRDNNGREWKVFIQESSKVIKLFNTQLEALEYAKQIAKNKNDGSYVILHGLDGKIRKY